MTSIFIPKSLVFTAALLLTACAQMGGTMTQHHDILVNQDASPTHLSVGQTVVVKLTSNPSTGYGWDVKQTEHGVLQQVNHAFEQQHTNPPMPGAGGTEVWAFKALKTGQQTLHFAYSRSWEKDIAPVQQANYTIIVE